MSGQVGDYNGVAARSSRGTGLCGASPLAPAVARCIAAIGKPTAGPDHRETDEIEERRFRRRAADCAPSRSTVDQRTGRVWPVTPPDWPATSRESPFRWLPIGHVAGMAKT